MANGHENLIPLDQKTKEEQREICSKGGKASQKVQAEKRTFKKAIEWLANSDIKITKGTMHDLLKENGIDTSKLNPTQMASIGLWFGAVQGNATNFKTLMEANNEITEGGVETPTLKVEIVDHSELEKTLYETNQPKENDNRE